MLARLRDRSDAAAWDEFCQRYGELIHGFARRRGLSDVDCDDLVQDVLMALNSAMPGFTYDPGRGRFRSYIKAAVIRAVARRSCQTRGGVSLEDVENVIASHSASEAVEDQWEKEWRHHHLRTAMRTIEAEFSATDRNAFQLYAVEGRDGRETARTLGISVDAVYQAKSRILRRLTRLIEAQVAEEG